jgi:peptidyl-prolyl cis-trans isomerase B (cyclophilin B)
MIPMSEQKNPIAVIELENGKTMKAELYPDKAPNTVANFIALANAKFYDGLIFHRCIPGFMIQGGCPRGNGTGGPGYSIPGEFAANGLRQNDLRHTLGVLSMARAMHPDSAGSQFFVMVDAAPHLDGDYAAFGQVFDGEDEAVRISQVPTDHNDKPKTPVVIRSIRVDTQGVEYPAPKKCAER